MRVFTRTGGADVSHRDVTIETRDGKQGYRVLVTSRTGSTRRILGILKKSVSWVESCLKKKTVDFRLLAEALRRVRTRLGCRWKNQNRKNVYPSPYVEEPLNSKVIKISVPELRSHKCFSCFEILKGDLELAKNYRGLTLTSIAAKSTMPYYETA